MSSLIKRIFSKIRFHLFLSEDEKRIHRFGLEGEISLAQGFYHLKRFETKVDKNHFDWILLGYHHLMNLESCNKDLQFVWGNDRVLINHLGGTYAIRNKVDCYILNEILGSGVYNFHTNSRVSVIDIGMNVGHASIFFASNDLVDKVYSFEPVEMTYKYAIDNIDLNPTLRDKIVPFNFGLSKGNSSSIFRIDTGDLGRSGKVGNLNFKEASTEIEVFLKDCIEVLDPIIENSNQEFVVKIDCEGGEIDIIPELLKLKKLPILIMMEWHLDYNHKMREFLLDKDYLILEQCSEMSTGLIYAYRR